MNLHGKFVQNCRQKGVARKPESASEEIAKNDNFIRCRSRNLLIKGSTTITSRKETNRLTFPDKVCSDLGFTENKGRREWFQTLCRNKIPRININISEIFSLGSDLPIFTIFGLRSSSRNWVALLRLGVFRSLNFPLGRWNTSSGQLLRSHESSCAFNTGHLFDKNTSTSPKMTFVKQNM
jgi:hypothetical protein